MMANRLTSVSRVCLALMVLTTGLVFGDPEDRQETLLIIGAAGEEDYADRFAEAATLWSEASRQAGSELEVIGMDASTDSDRERIQKWLDSRPRQATRPLWIVYLGHGSHNRLETLLNLRGPDISARDLAEWTQEIERTLIFIHGGSASAPIIPAISGPNRILVTATRSGEEVNYARFGESFAEALQSPQTDINQDGQNSVLEVFLTAARSVERFYEENGRLATEHALIDDNGDGIGTPYSWFRGTRAVKTPVNTKSVDGDLARRASYIPSPFERTLSPSQIEQRNALEKEIESLRQSKDSHAEIEYYSQLEALFLRLAEIYQIRDDEADTNNP